MLKGKFLVVALVLSIIVNVQAGYADPIIELAAPRVAPKIISDEATEIPKQTDATTSTKPDKKVKKTLTKKHKKHIKKKPAPVKINYNRVSKLIEYGYYDYADKILDNAITRNPKDIKAQSLQVVSMAKQCKLEPAQSRLNELLKRYPDNSNLHYAQGIVYYQRTTSSNMIYRGNSDKLINDALNEFKKSISLDKTNASAYNAAGVITLNQGKADEAKAYFNKSLNADKTYSLAMDNLGTIDFLEGKLDSAEKNFKNALVHNSQNTTAMYHLAQIAMQKQNTANALYYLNNALYVNSNSPAIYNLMGKAYLAQGNDAAAINAFKQSISVKPEFALSYLDLAGIYEKRGDYEFAIEQLKTLLSIEPCNYDAKLKLADISLGSGKYKPAIDAYAELIGVDGYNDAALKGIASAYYGQAQLLIGKTITSNKDAFKALESINNAIKANPKDLELYLAKLKLAQILNQPEETKVALNKIISSPDKDLAALITKGEAYIALNDYKNAKTSFDSAIALSKTPDEDMYLSEILLLNKQLDLAQVMLNKILKYDADNPQILAECEFIKKSKIKSDNFYKSGMYFAKHKNYSSAIEYLNRSIMINPDNPEAHLQLARLLDKQKNYADALKHYNAYLSLVPENTNNAVQRRAKSLENEL